MTMLWYDKLSMSAQIYFGRDAQDKSSPSLQYLSVPV
jgi:hypothetical protein